MISEDRNLRRYRKDMGYPMMKYNGNTRKNSLADDRRQGLYREDRGYQMLENEGDIGKAGR